LPDGFGLALQACSAFGKNPPCWARQARISGLTSAFRHDKPRLQIFGKPTGNTMIQLTRPLALIPLALILALVAAPMALAQETAPAEPAAPVDGTAAQAPAGDLAIGTEVPADGVGATYTQEVFTDWELRCIRSAEGDDPCQLYQLLKDEGGNSVAEVSLFTLPAGQQAIAGATIVTPLETLLTEDILVQVDSGAAKRYPFSFCTEGGCIARLGFTAEDIAGLKAGAKATVTIVPVAASDQKVNLNLSLNGFTAGYAALEKLPQQ